MLSANIHLSAHSQNINQFYKDGNTKLPFIFFLSSKNRINNDEYTILVGFISTPLFSERLVLCFFVILCYLLSMLKITLKKNEDRRIKTGHPWIFSNEIAAIDGMVEPGIAAELVDGGGSFIGRGYYTPHSLIAFRLLTRQRENVDSAEFYEQRFSAALAHRRGIYPSLQTFRAIYGESDFLPGLVVDKYEEYLSLQILSAGMERRRDLILEALKKVFAPCGIIARNDVAVRSLEKLEQTVEVLFGEIPDLVEMKENGLRFLVDLRHGQKTGGFLDQKENHLLLRGICAGKNVLDCFCYSGSWAAHAGSFGAKAVLGIDISARAVAMAARTAELNSQIGRAHV